MGTSSGDIRCKVCGDRPPAKGRTICERCKKQQQRDREAVGLDGKVKPREDPPEESRKVPSFPVEEMTKIEIEDPTEADLAWWDVNSSMGLGWAHWGGLQTNTCTAHKPHHEFETHLSRLRDCGART